MSLSISQSLNAVFRLVCRNTLVKGKHYATVFVRVLVHCILATVSDASTASTHSTLVGVCGPGWMVNRQRVQ